MTLSTVLWSAGLMLQVVYAQRATVRRSTIIQHYTEFLIILLGHFRPRQLVAPRLTGWRIQKFLLKVLALSPRIFKVHAVVVVRGFYPSGLTFVLMVFRMNQPGRSLFSRSRLMERRKHTCLQMARQEQYVLARWQYIIL